MATTTTPRLGLKKQAAGDNPGAWEVDLNDGFDDADDRFFRSGVVTPVDADSPDGDADYIGQRYYDTVTKRWYTATGVGEPGTWVQAVVANEGNTTPSINQGLASALPASVEAGHIYIETDSKRIKRDDGAAYVEIGGLLGFGFLGGMNLALGSDALHDIDIAKGACRSSQDDVDIKLSSVFTKQIDFPWAVGTGLGGLFSGVVAADTSYHVFVIVKDDDFTVDAGFDTSITAANIPAGYTSYRRVGSIRTKAAAAEIEDVDQTNDRFDYKIGVSQAETILSASATSITLKGIPPGVKCMAHVWIDMADGNERFIWVKALSQDGTIAPSISDHSHSISDVVSGADFAHGVTHVMTDNAQRIHARRNAGTDAVTVRVMGYDDYRGKDGQGAV